MLLIVLLYCIIALTFVFAKDAVLVSSPVFFIAIRMILAAGLLFLSEYIQKRKIALPQKSDAWLFLVVSLLHIYIPFVGEFWALQYLDALKVNFLFALTPFFAVTIEALHNKKLPALRTVSGIIIGFCALIFLLIIKDQGSLFTTMEYLSTLSLPEFVLLCSVISATTAWFFIKQLTKERYTIVSINAWCMLFGGLLSFMTSYFFEEIQIINYTEFVKNLFLLIVLSNVLFYNLYGKLLQKYSMTLLTATGFLSPFFGILFEGIITRTMPNHLYFISLLFVALGLYFVAKDSK